jgi:hypothetical protein
MQLSALSKAKVEAAVLVAQRWILAVLRHRTLYSLAELNAASAELLAGAVLPQLPRLPQDEGKEAHKDVRLHPIGTLVPDGADAELILLDPERRFGLGQLDVGLLELLVRPVVNRGSEKSARCGARSSSGCGRD